MAATTSGVIQRLDETVVNRIAAGEVIQRPANALKELVENCLDAKATNIQVTVRDGGLKLLNIQDNGTGIRREDMEIVCERFTTSKIHSFDDLTTVATYGFRGEALASISHVAHVTIVTRTADAKCAFRGSYCDGKLKEPVKPCAGNVGTQITVEDLFYNVPTRRKALRSPSEEHQKVTEVVSRYAIHNASVGFTLKKQADSNSDVKTPPNSTQVDNIRTIYGPAVARELLEVNVEDSKLSIKLHALVSNANYNVKRAIFLLFINNRLVDSTALRKAIDVVYAAYLPKNTHPFVYISLQIAPQNVDVNVHPTKHEIHFLHEESIVETVQRAVDTRLLGANSSRTYYLQTLKPVISTNDDISTDSSKTTNLTAVTSASRVYAQNLVRTDSREQKLDAFLVSTTSTVSRCTVGPVDAISDRSRQPHNRLSADVSASSSQNSLSVKPSLADCSLTADFSQNNAMEFELGSTTRFSINDDPAMDRGESGGRVSGLAAPGTVSVVMVGGGPSGEAGSQRREIKLTSILQLQQAVESNIHTGLRAILQNHTFVGCVSPEFSLLQHDTKLYLVNTTTLSKELFYQLTIFNFGNIGFMRLSEPAPVYELAMLALDGADSGWTPDDGPKDDLAKYVVELLTSKCDMLMDYFSLEIDSAGNLLSLPLLLDKYIPSIEGLPMFVLRLATEVEWDVEKDCFDTFARETAEFFAVKSKWLSTATDDNNSCDEPLSQDTLVDNVVSNDTSAAAAAAAAAAADGSVGGNVATSWQWMVEHVVFPALRSSLIPSQRFTDDGTVLQIANMPDLYKVFERC